MSSSPEQPGNSDPPPGNPLLPEEKLQRLEYLRKLLETQRAYEEGGGVIRKPWREIARPNQLPPDEDFFIWLLLAGRLGRIRENKSCF